MATIRAFTSLEQSKTLSKILPPESADMRIGNYVGESGKVDGTNIHYYPKGESFGAPEIIYAWSLAALLDVLPRIEDFKPVLDLEINCIQYPSDIDLCAIADNPVDACVAMVEKLHELNLL